MFEAITSFFTGKKQTTVPTATGPAMSSPAAPAAPASPVTGELMGGRRRKHRKTHRKGGKRHHRKTHRKY